MKASGNLRQSAELVGIKRSTASDIWQRYKRTGSTRNLHRSGRPEKLDDRGKRAVMREVLQDRKKPFTEVAKNIPGDISADIVRRVAAGEGYHRRVARKATFLTARQKRKRLEWAEDFDGIDDEEWDNLCPSDECYVELDDSKGRVYITRRSDEEYKENCLVPNFKQSPVKVMIWACFMRGVKGPLVVLEYPGGKGGGMNTDRYISQVLKPHLAPFYHRMEKERPGIIFQQDGAPSHTAKATKKWLAEHNIDLFPHPPNSPDLNPIEPLWHDLKTLIRASPHLPTTVPKLIQAVQDAWEKLPISDFDKHIKTMPNRVQAVLAAKGGHTQF